MEFENLVQYFEDIIEQYAPYKNKTDYQVFISFLKDNFYKYLYEDVPSDFKTLYEDNYILPSVYNNLLVSFGVHQEVIEQMSLDEKFIFINALSDFYRIKGSIEFFKRVGQSFYDLFNVYELFIDYDIDPNDGEKKWLLKPYLVYKDSNVTDEPKSLPYIDVFNTVPSLLISPQRLTELNENNQLILPIKSNLVLLDYTIIQYADALNKLIVCTFLKEYGEYVVELYFQDRIFSMKLKDVFYVWYYLMTRYFGTSWLSNKSTFFVHYRTSANPYTLEDIDRFVQEYQQLETVDEIYDFYRDKISSVLGTAGQYPSMTEENMFTSISTTNLEFANYINERILTSTDRHREIRFITDEIYNSLILYERKQQFDPMFQKYYRTFLESLPNLIVDPKNTTSYVILYNFKPYHVELVSEYRQYIVSDDKFNRTTPNDSNYSFVSKLLHNDFVSELMHEVTFSLEIPKWSALDTVSTIEFDTDISKYNELKLEDRLKNVISKYSTSVIQLAENSNFASELVKNTKMPLIDNLVISILKSYFDENKINDFIQTSQSIDEASVLQLAQNNTHLFNLIENSKLSIIDDTVLKFTKSYMEQRFLNDDISLGTNIDASSVISMGVNSNIKMDTLDLIEKYLALNIEIYQDLNTEIKESMSLSDTFEIEKTTS